MGENPVDEAVVAPHSLSYAAAHGTVAAFEPGPRWASVRRGVLWVEWGVIAWVLGLVMAVVAGVTMGDSTKAQRGLGAMPAPLLASIVLGLASHALIVVGMAMCAPTPPGLADGRLPVIGLSLFAVAGVLNGMPLLNLPKLEGLGILASAVATWCFTRYLMRIAKLLKRRDLSERGVLVGGGLVLIFVLLGVLFVSTVTARLGWGMAYLGIVAILLMFVMGLVVLSVYVLLLHRTAAVLQKRLRVG